MKIIYLGLIFVAMVGCEKKDCICASCDIYRTHCIMCEKSINLEYSFETTEIMKPGRYFLNTWVKIEDCKIKTSDGVSISSISKEGTIYTKVPVDVHKNYLKDDSK